MYKENKFVNDKTAHSRQDAGWSSLVNSRLSTFSFQWFHCHMNGDRKHLTEEDGRGDTRWSLEEGRLKHARALIQFKIGIMLAFYGSNKS